MADINLRPLIFSLNCFVAAMLGLFVSFSLNLDSPGWVMTTVYITSQPLSGVMRAKAFYRLIGTLVGGVAMIAIVPNFVNAPELATLAIIVWVSLCIFLSVLDRTPRSYLFALSGYTAALIGFPSVQVPGSVFDVAISRMEEISIGVICAAVVHSVFFPASAFFAFQQKLGTTLKNFRLYAVAALSGSGTVSSVQQRRQIAADISELYVLGTSLRFDTAPFRPRIGDIRALDRAMVALLPLISAIEDRLNLLRGSGKLDKKFFAVISSAQDFMRASAPWPDAELVAFRSSSAAAVPAIHPKSEWTDLLKINVLTRLGEFVESWQSCLRLSENLGASKSESLKSDAKPSDAEFVHRDFGMALLSCLSVATAMGICAFTWIATAWTNGAFTVAIAAVLCGLFSSLDNPAPIIKKVAQVAALCTPIVIIIQFVLLPAVTGFLLLSLVLALVLIPAGIMMAIPAYAPFGLALSLAFSIELGVQPSYSADLASILNSNSAIVVGALVAAVITSLIRSIGAEESAARILRATYRDLAELADGRTLPTREQWASKMLDRVALLLYRQPFQSKPQHEFADALNNLLLGVNIIETRNAISKTPDIEGKDAAKMFQEIALHFRALAQDRVLPLKADLLGRIDAAIRQILAPDKRAVSGVTAMVGLRRTLYPEASPYLSRR